MTHPVNFLYLGGDKCGSTWVHHILSQHPDVTLAHAKELFYFDRFYHKGADWYAKQFPDQTEGVRTGEVCHDYLYSEKALHRIARDLPLDSRFLVTVRAPLDRTVSHYKYLRKIGRTKAPITEALSTQPQIVEHSLFGKYVARAQAILGADRVHVVPFELLKTDPTAFGRAMSAALSIRFLPDLPYADRVLEAQSARNPAFVRMLRNVGWAVRAVGAPQIVSRVKSNPLVSRALFATNAPAPSADLSDHCRAELNTRFEQDRQLLDACVPNLWRAPS